MHLNAYYVYYRGTNQPDHLSESPDYKDYNTFQESLLNFASSNNT